MELRTDQMQAFIAPTYKENIVSAEQTATKVSAEINTKYSEPLKTDQVTISDEAREKSIDDKNQAAMRKLLGKEETDKTNGKGEQSLEEKMAELQEKITKLMAELAQERRSGDEEKIKSMEAELAMLNLQMLQLIEQKNGIRVIFFERIITN